MISRMGSMNGISSRVRSVIWLALWMGIIFAFSSMHGATHGHALPWWMILERKAAHVIEYFILTGLAFRCVRLHLPRITMQTALAFAAVFALSYAFSDETHQLFVPGREGKLSDVGVDVIGIVLATAVVGTHMQRKSNG